MCAIADHLRLQWSSKRLWDVILLTKSTALRAWENRYLNELYTAKYTWKYNSWVAQFSKQEIQACELEDITKAVSCCYWYGSIACLFTSDILTVKCEAVVVAFHTATKIEKKVSLLATNGRGRN